MKALVKSILVVGQVFDLVIGTNLAAPADVIQEQYRDFRFEY